MQNEVQEFTVRDRLGPVKFTGRILADCRYGRMDKPRWTDMALYEITDPQRTMRSVEEIETELAQDLTKEPPFQELPEEQADALIGSMMPHIIPRIMNEQRPYRYVLEYIARSYVYHRADGPCARAHHRWTTVGHIKVSNHRWRNLFPCTRCKPEDLEDLDDNVRIAEEQEKSHPFVCTDAVDIVNHLYRKNGEITQLAAKVLIQAAGRDPEIRRAMKNRRL